jgi:hypothetical protein
VAFIEPLTFADCWWVAIDLRDEDKRELAVTRDVDDAQSLVESALDSEFKWTAAINSHVPPDFAFGARFLDGGKGAQVWGFGTPRAKSVLRPVTRFIQRVMVPQLLDSGVQYARAISHPANTTSHRWLEHLGFTLRAKLAGIGVRREDMFLFETSAFVHKRNALPTPSTPALVAA